MTDKLVEEAKKKKVNVFIIIGAGFLLVLGFILAMFTNNSSLIKRAMMLLGKKELQDENVKDTLDKAEKQKEENKKEKEKAEAVVAENKIETEKIMEKIDKQIEENKKVVSPNVSKEEKIKKAKKVAEENKKILEGK